MNDFPLTDWPKLCFGGFWIRLGAFLIDRLLIQALTKIIFNLTIHHFISPQAGSAMWSYQALQLLVVVAYFAGTMIYLEGQTVGKCLLNLKVVSLKTDQLDRQTILVREVAGRIILHYFPIVAISLVFTPHRQHLIDLFCDTAVINQRAVTEWTKFSAQEQV